MNDNIKLTPEKLRDKMFSDVWSALSEDKKIDVLQQISDNHLKELGIAERRRAPLEFVSMRAGINGAYNPDKNKIILNKDLLRDENMFRVVDTLCHEGYHSYQYDLIKHPKGYPEGQENAETIKKWKENMRPGAYIYDGDLLYGEIYSGQSLESGAFPHGLSKMKQFFESKMMSRDEQRKYEEGKAYCESGFQKLERKAETRLGPDYLRKADIVVIYRGINEQANELLYEMDNKQKASSEMSKEIKEIKKNLDKASSWDLLPASLKRMSEQELQNTEKELSDLQHRLDNLQKQYEKSLHTTKTISMGYEERSVDIASVAQTTLAVDSKAQARAQQQPADEGFDFHKTLAAHIQGNEEMYAQLDAQRGGQQQVAQQTVQPDNGIARC